MGVLVLASQSPRRRQLLDQLGVSYAVRPQDIDESVRPGEQAEIYVARVAAEKAQAALREDSSAVVLAADTSVIIDGKILGKPADSREAADMLSLLSGRSHQVLSAVTMADRQRKLERLNISEVCFRSLSEAEINDYWRSGEPRGKAGAYAIQGFGAAFVKSLCGSHSGVMGLPLFETAELLDAFGVARWQQESKS